MRDLFQANWPLLARQWSKRNSGKLPVLHYITWRTAPAGINSDCARKPLYADKLEDFSL
jgi:hypothetical protein